MHLFTESKQKREKNQKKKCYRSARSPSVAHFFVVKRKNIWADKLLIISVARGIIVDYQQNMRHHSPFTSDYAMIKLSCNSALSRLALLEDNMEIMMENLWIQSWASTGRAVDDIIMESQQCVRLINEIVINEKS